MSTGRGTAADEPILFVDSVARRFGTRRVLSAATLSVLPGRVTILFGRNGCGKTTLLRIVTGTVSADAGHVRFRGRIRQPPRLSEMAGEGLFYIPDRDLLSRGRWVADHFDMLMRRFGGDRVHRAIELLRVGELLERPRDRLSGGEIRRAEVALALARSPACLIADEPFLGLAPADAELIAAAFRDLAAEGTAVLLTGHEVETLLGVADTVVWMTAGTTCELGPPAAARLHDQFRREYLGPGRLERLNPTAAPGGVRRV